jgi:hypothetical protein
MTIRLTDDVPTITAAPDDAERRTHVRLRDLCDEVLASYRVAREGDLITEADRTEAKAVLARVHPLARVGRRR